MVTDADGNPLVGAGVRLFESGQLIVGTTTDDTGRYRFLLLRGGQFEVVAAYDGASFSSSTVDVAADATVEQDIVSGDADLTVTVTDAEASVDRSIVVLHQLIGGRRYLAGSAFANNSGIVRFANLAAGQYEVTAVGADRRTAVAAVTIADGAAAEVTAPLADTFSVRGLVTDTGGSPIPGARVLLVSKSDPSRQSVAISANNGAFQLDGITQGEYELIAFADGFTAAVDTDVSVIGDLQQNVALSVSQTEIAGRVLGPDGQPIGQGVVRFTDSAGRLVDEQPIAADGTFLSTSAQGTGIRATVVILGYSVLIVSDIASLPGQPVNAGDLAVEPVAIGQGVGERVTPTDPPIGALGRMVDGLVPPADDPAPSEAHVDYDLSGLDPRIQQLLANASPEIVQLSIGSAFLGALIDAIASFTFGSGDFLRVESTEIPASLISPLPNNCSGCASLRNQAVAAQQAQGIRAEIAEIFDGDLNSQRIVVAGVLVSEVFVVLGSFAALVVAIEGMAAAWRRRPQPPPSPRWRRCRHRGRQRGDGRTAVRVRGRAGSPRRLGGQGRDRGCDQQSGQRHCQGVLRSGQRRIQQHDPAVREFYGYC